MSRSPGVRAGLASVFLLGAVAAGTGQAQAPQPPRPTPVPGFERTQAWFQHVNAHEPWRWDASAAAVAALPRLSLQAVFVDLELIHSLIEAAAEEGDESVQGRGRTLRVNRLGALLGLTARELDLPVDLRQLAKPEHPARLAIGRVMTRAALLHTLIAVSSSDVPAERSAPAGPDQATRLYVATGTAERIQDGQLTHVVDRSVHWAIGRAAFDLVGPPPAGSAAAQAWYRASTSFLQHERNYAALVPHLEHARRIMPSDPRTFLFSGVAYENLAGPAVQAALPQPGQSTVDRKTRAALLETAETYLHRALELGADAGLTRVRLGRVVDLRGRHDDAAELLRQAESSLSDPVWRYYAALYLGRAEESRGNDAEAHAAYSRATVLFPRAQSPQLALADLKWRGADQEGALSGLRALFAMPDTTSRDADPWWLYDVSHVGDLTAPFEALRLAAAEVLR